MPRSSGQLGWMDGSILASARVIRNLETRENALKAPELAKILGVTRQHVYKMAADGLIPSFHIGGAVRFDPALVAEWLSRKMPKPAVIAETRRIAG
jgi:excisionase family DNA binding protein